MGNSARVGYALAIFLCIMFVIVSMRPSFIFDTSGNVRRFGVSDRSGRDSIFAGVIVSVVVAAVSVLIAVTPEFAASAKAE